MILMRLPFCMVPVDKWVAFNAPLPKDKHRIIIIKKIFDEVQFFYVTSQVDNAKRVLRYDLGCIAELGKSDWESLTADKSCVQCDKRHLGIVKLDVLERMYNDGKLEYIGEVPDVVKTRIKSAICSSKSFTDIEKKFYSL